MRKKKILFVCVENAGRSQMAEAFARLHGEGKIEAWSAGTLPAERVNATVVQVMKEKGIDLSSNTPRMLTVDMIKNASIVITMGCSVDEVCPKPIIAQMQKKLIDWHLEDPKGKPVEEVRRIRDEIERRVLQLLREK